MTVPFSNRPPWEKWLSRVCEKGQLTHHPYTKLPLFTHKDIILKTDFLTWAKVNGIPSEMWNSAIFQVARGKILGKRYRELGIWYRDVPSFEEMTAQLKIVMLQPLSSKGKQYILL